MDFPTFNTPDPEPGHECDSRRIPYHVTEDLYKLTTEQLLLRIYRESLAGNQSDGGRISKTIGKASTLLIRLSNTQAETAAQLLIVANHAKELSEKNLKISENTLEISRRAATAGDRTLIIAKYTLWISVLLVVAALQDDFVFLCTKLAEVIWK